MLLSPLQLQQLWGPPAVPAPEPQPPLTAISTDSRRLEPGSLFVPLVGERHDGHAFLESVIDSGHCRAAVAQAERLPAEAVGPLLELATSRGCALWWQPCTLTAYQQLAGLWRQQLAAAVVAVTGSAGKTTTRELIRAALGPLGPVLASSGNNNNDVGVPLTLLDARADHRALVVEMGMRGLGEIERLSRCATPDVAVITNIGTAHIGRLGSREAIATAKCEIALGLRPGGLMVIPAGDPLLERALAQVWGGRVVRVALAGDGPEAEAAADLLGRLCAEGRRLQVEAAPKGAAPEGAAPEGAAPERARPWQAELELPLAGRHNARNLLLALAVARELGLAAEPGVPLAVQLPGGRSHRLSLGGITVLDETYNASPEAVLAALELLAGCRGGRRYAVLGTMLELGERSLELHELVARRAVELGLDGLLIVASGGEGEAMLAAAGADARPGACPGLHLARVDTPQQALAPLLSWLQAGDSVLLKASRGVALEQLIPPLEQALTSGSPR